MVRTASASRRQAIALHIVVLVISTRPGPAGGRNAATDRLASRGLLLG